MKISVRLKQVNPSGASLVWKEASFAMLFPRQAGASLSGKNATVILKVPGLLKIVILAFSERNFEQ